MINVNNYFVVERLGCEHLAEALREADRSRLARLAETARRRMEKVSWSKIRGRVMMPDAAGAREMPSL